MDIYSCVAVVVAAVAAVVIIATKAGRKINLNVKPKIVEGQINID